MKSRCYAFRVQSLFKLCDYKCFKPHREYQTNTANKCVSSHEDYCIHIFQHIPNTVKSCKDLRCTFKILWTSVESSNRHFHDIFIFSVILQSKMRWWKGQKNDTFTNRSSHVFEGFREVFGWWEVISIYCEQARLPLAGLCVWDLATEYFEHACDSTLKPGSKA